MNENFRLRGENVSRLEGFSDAVFGFALTLLVVSLEVPRTFGQLDAMVGEFLPFAATFASLVLIWHMHHAFFRAYGLVDQSIMLLNSLLLFITLFYIYPLKFLFTLLGRVIQGDITVVLDDGRRVAMITWLEIGDLYTLYGAGGMALFGTLAAMHYHALQKREELALTPFEVFKTKGEIRRMLLMVAVAGCSVGLAVVLRRMESAWVVSVPGFVYFLNFLNFPLEAWEERQWAARKAREVHQEATETERSGSGPAR